MDTVKRTPKFEKPQLLRRWVIVELFPPKAAGMEYLTPDPIPLEVDECLPLVKLKLNSGGNTERLTRREYPKQRGTLH